MSEITFADVPAPTPEVTAAVSSFFARVAGGEGEADVIIDVIRRAVMAERKNAVEDVLDMLLCHELYQYRPRAFNGFVDYARTTLTKERPAHRSTTPSPNPSKQVEEAE